MFFSRLKLLELIFRETISTKGFERCPEPSVIMKDPQNVESFHAQGADRGALIPIYHFNALSISALLPYGGNLVDLGSGSGQFISYLARCRPDSRIIGLDLSEEMVKVGNRALKNSGLETNVSLYVGDMTNFSKQIPEKVDVISSIFAFHHLPSSEDLIRCSVEIKKVRERCGCGVWIFDHVRPRNRHTSEVFPEIFTPEASAEFRQDSRNSLLASFSYTELSKCIDYLAIGNFHHVCSRLMRLYQIHWLELQDGKKEKQHSLCKGTLLKSQEYKKFRLLKTLFSKVPF